MNTPKSEKRTQNDDHDGNEKKVEVGELGNNNGPVSEQAVEHCKKCDEPAYGFMVLLLCILLWLDNLLQMQWLLPYFMCHFEK